MVLGRNQCAGSCVPKLVVEELKCQRAASPALATLVAGPQGTEETMSLFGAGLRTIGLDVKAVARQRGADQPNHPLLPAQVLAMTRYWLKLGGKTAPHWPQF